MSEPKTNKQETLEEWWDADAERLNKMAETSGLLDLGEGKPPALDADGILKSEDESDDE
jgi:hypothetical protein